MSYCGDVVVLTIHQQKFTCDVISRGVYKLQSGYGRTLVNSQHSKQNDRRKSFQCSCVVSECFVVTANKK